MITRSQISDLLPQHFEDDYPKFIDFITSYFKWLNHRTSGVASDRAGGAADDFMPVAHLDREVSLIDTKDGESFITSDGDALGGISHMGDTLTKWLYEAGLVLSPGYLDKVYEDGNGGHWRLDAIGLVKRMNDLWDMRGSKKGIEVLFRLFTGTEVAVTFPREQLAAVDDGMKLDDYDSVLRDDDYWNEYTIRVDINDNVAKILPLIVDVYYPYFHPAGFKIAIGGLDGVWVDDVVDPYESCDAWLAALNEVGYIPWVDKDGNTIDLGNRTLPSSGLVSGTTWQLRTNYGKATYVPPVIPFVPNPINYPVSCDSTGDIDVTNEVETSLGLANYESWGDVTRIDGYGNVYGWVMGATGLTPGTPNDTAAIQRIRIGFDGIATIIGNEISVPVRRDPVPASFWQADELPSSGHANDDTIVFAIPTEDGESNPKMEIQVVDDNDVISTVGSLLPRRADTNTTQIRDQYGTNAYMTNVIYMDGEKFRVLHCTTVANPATFKMTEVLPGGATTDIFTGLSHDFGGGISISSTERFPHGTTDDGSFLLGYIFDSGSFQMRPVYKFFNPDGSTAGSVQWHDSNVSYKVFSTRYSKSGENWWLADNTQPQSNTQRHFRWSQVGGLITLTHPNSTHPYFDIQSSQEAQQVVSNNEYGYFCYTGVNTDANSTILWRYPKGDTVSDSYTIVDVASIWTFDMSDPDWVWFIGPTGTVYRQAWGETTEGSHQVMYTFSMTLSPLGSPQYHNHAMLNGNIRHVVGGAWNDPLELYTQYLQSGDHGQLKWCKTDPGEIWLSYDNDYYTTNNNTAAQLWYKNATDNDWTQIGMPIAHTGTNGLQKIETIHPVGNDKEVYLIGRENLPMDSTLERFDADPKVVVVHMDSTDGTVLDYKVVADELAAVPATDFDLNVDILDVAVNEVGNLVVHAYDNTATTWHVVEMNGLDGATATVHNVVDENAFNYMASARPNQASNYHTYFKRKIYGQSYVTTVNSTPADQQIAWTHSTGCVVNGERYGFVPYVLTNSLVFDGTNNADQQDFLERTFSGGNDKLWTYSFWVKRVRSPEDFTQNLNPMSVDRGANPWSTMEIEPTGPFAVKHEAAGPYTRSAADFSDTTNWYHFVVVYDADAVTDTDRQRIFVNNQELFDLNNNTFPTLGQSGDFNTNNIHRIGKWIDGGTGHRNSQMVMSAIHFIDGQALLPTEFAETDVNGKWMPKKYTGTYGTTGFELLFDDVSTAGAVGTDTSGNGNHWTLNNQYTTNFADLITGDTPSDNYATFNSAHIRWPTNYNSNVGLYRGATRLIATSSSEDLAAFSTMSFYDGKWRCEITMEAFDAASFEVGVTPYNRGEYISLSSGAYGYDVISGDTWESLANTTTGGTTFAEGDVIGLEFDADIGRLEIFKGATSVKVITGIPKEIYVFSFQSTNAVAKNNIIVGNFGQKAWANSPSSGFGACKESRVPDFAIMTPRQGFNVVRWTGDDAASRAITGVGFQPGLLISKTITTSTPLRTYDHLSGSARLDTAVTSAEDTSEQYVTSLDADGFTLNTNNLNSSGVDFFGWCWKSDPTYGIEVLEYTGDDDVSKLIPHNLGAEPEVMIVKRRDATGSWYVYFKDLGPTAYFTLHAASAPVANADIWNNTQPTSTHFTVGTHDGVNELGGEYTAILFRSVPGFSKFGSYEGVGTGSYDNVFLNFGFRPLWFMTKQNSSSNGWWAYDTVREDSEDGRNRLFRRQALHTNTTQSSAAYDFVSTGIAFNGSSASRSTSGSTYYFMAFADVPFKHGRAF